MGRGPKWHQPTRQAPTPCACELSPADRCPHIQVTVVDLNAKRIAAWNDPDLSQLPVYEPGLAEVVGRCRGRNLNFSTAVEPAIASADMVFIAVNTPTKSRGLGAGQASDLRWIEACARTVAAHATGHTVVVEKSTLCPVRSAEIVKAILSASRVHTAKRPGSSFLQWPKRRSQGSARSAKRSSSSLVTSSGIWQALTP